MRVLLRPVLVPELRLVVLKPGRESMPVFHNTRVLVEPEPKSMRNLPSGVVPAVRQPLAEDKSLLPFFSDERVIRAAGGAGGNELRGNRRNAWRAAGHRPLGLPGNFIRQLRQAAGFLQHLLPGRG